MASGLGAPVLTGLALGTGFVIMFAALMPVILDYGKANGSDLVESATSMPATYFLNNCTFPSVAASANFDGVSPAQRFYSGVDRAFIQVKDRNWISVMRVDAGNFDGAINAPCTILTTGLASQIPSLMTAIRGADGCSDGTEVCAVSYGISIGGDELDYELTLTREEVAAILRNIRLGQYNSAIIANGNSFYLMRFSSMDTKVGSVQIETQFLEPVPQIPIPLAAGESVIYTLLVRTWATYGGPASIDLTASSSARDSGLLVAFEPSTLEVNERSEARALLTITATQNVRNGTYDVNVGGTINDAGLIPSGPCDHSCPAIRIGDSPWNIMTFGSDMRMWQSGPGKVPDWLRLEVDIAKKMYSSGEQIEIKTYLVNDGADKVVLDGEDSSRRLMIMISGPSENSTAATSVYGIDAYDLGTDPITIEHKSKLLLVRPFIWDQKTFASQVEPYQVSSGTYSIAVSFGGYSNAVLYAGNEVTISPGSDLY
ncbi:MAG: hypothetical protein ACREBU_04870 [Nitrososphaera sp.]